MAKSIPKTNAMRILEKEHISYTMHTYDPDGEIDGISVAHKLGQDPKQVFKTLVTKGRSGDYYVFVIPVAEELNLKAAAAAVGEKSVEMLHVKDLCRVTGYIRGGCSPIGMKKQFVTVLDLSAQQLAQMIVSGGKIGFQIELSPSDLAKAAKATFAPLTL
ncbi:MAG: Cys-tRNA(Pro) deacylase [Oscillospiraceae bacterium]|nr:Cys-tRNA(Pro) deacylase [Oscillospiraceae bacterium]